MVNKIFAGVDEVGRGCLAGPVVSCAVILKKSINKKILKDSKTISFKDRLRIAEHIKKNSWYAIGSASVKEIDKYNNRRFHSSIGYKKPMDVYLSAFKNAV